MYNPILVRFLNNLEKLEKLEFLREPNFQLHFEFYHIIDMNIQYKVPRSSYVVLTRT